MSDELVPMEDETGSYENKRKKATVPADGVSSALVILTTISLIISIVLIGIQLNTVYGIGK